MKKILFCSALAAVALSSCSSDDFMGDTQEMYSLTLPLLISMVVLVKLLVQQLKPVLQQQQLLVIAMLYMVTRR